MVQTAEVLAEVNDALDGSEARLADGFEDALIGWVQRFNATVPLYDRERCIEILMQRDGMDYDGANDFFDFNVVGSWVGDGTPAFATVLRSFPRTDETSPG